MPVISESGMISPPREPHPVAVAIRRDIEKRERTFSDAARYVKQMPEGRGDELHQRLTDLAWAYHLAALIAAGHSFGRNMPID